MGRVYLPAEDLRRFGCTEAELAAGVVTPSVRELLRWEAQRAWAFYEEGARLIPKIDRDSRAALWALTRIYSGLLARIEESRFRCVLLARPPKRPRKKRAFCSVRDWGGGRRRMSSKSVIVIGAGLAGLSSAVALADAGFRVRLLEQRPFLGWPGFLLRLAGRRTHGQLPARHTGLLHESGRFLSPHRRRWKNRLLRPPGFRGCGWSPQRHGSVGLARASAPGAFARCFILALLERTPRHRQRHAGHRAARRAQRWW